MSAKKNLIKFVYNTSHNDVSYKQLQNSHICHIIIAKELVSAKKRLQKIPKIPEIPEIPGLQQKTTKKDYKKKTTKKDYKKDYKDYKDYKKFWKFRPESTWNRWLSVTSSTKHSR